MCTRHDPLREITVVAGILWKEDRILAVRRPQGKPRAGYWEFPGGKVEAGETLEQALERELHEELGVRPLEAQFWRHVSHAYPELLVCLHFFHVRSFQGIPRSLEGHLLEWITPDKAPEKSFLEADAAIVRDLKNYTQNI